MPKTLEEPPRADYAQTTRGAQSTPHIAFLEDWFEKDYNAQVILLQLVLNAEMYAVDGKTSWVIDSSSKYHASDPEDILRVTDSHALTRANKNRWKSDE